jgi:hypothetical protein
MDSAVALDHKELTALGLISRKTGKVPCAKIKFGDFGVNRDLAQISLLGRFQFSYDRTQNTE